MEWLIFHWGCGALAYAVLLADALEDPQILADYVEVPTARYSIIMVLVAMSIYGLLSLGYAVHITRLKNGLRWTA